LCFVSCSLTRLWFVKCSNILLDINFIECDIRNLAWRGKKMSASCLFVIYLMDTLHTSGVLDRCVHLTFALCSAVIPSSEGLNFFFRFCWYCCDESSIWDPEERCWHWFSFSSVKGIYEDWLLYESVCSSLYVLCLFFKSVIGIK